MGYTLPEKLQKLDPYAPVTGSYRIRADANESYLSAPDWLREELAEAVKGIDFNRYPDPYCARLCAAFAGYFGVPAGQVVAGNGSDELIGLIMSWFTSPGDTAVTVSPDFSMYAFYAQSCGVRLRVLEKEGLALSADALLATAREGDARLVIFSNPCNPTSLEASREEVLRVVEGLPGTLVVVDEAYMDFGEGSILGLAGHYDNLIVLKTCSKAFGMAAIRLGFAVACPTLAAALMAAKSPYNVNAMTQEAGRVLFSHPDYLRDCTERIKRGRDDLYRRLSALAERRAAVSEVQNTHTNFVYLRLADAPGAFRALADRGIAVRLMGDRLRISAGSAAENAELLAALEEIIQ